MDLYVSRSAALGAQSPQRHRLLAQRMTGLLESRACTRIGAVLFKLPIGPIVPS